ncbi:MAG: Occludin/ELL family protein [Synechococcaceae cyanobacterium]|nr:Occludin/ELL family protein [Synechococcaceae cyanobacterium]
MNHPILSGVLAGTLAAPLVAGLAPGVPALAGPVLCRTTLEAPAGSAGPVEVTRCGAVQTVPDLMQRRYYSYRAPFARGVDLTHQITDVLGIAMGGGDGTKVMGLGFPDQAIVWDGSAVGNTTAVLLEDQNSPYLLRTPDLPSCFGGSLAGTACAAGQVAQPVEPTFDDWMEPVRGLW